MTSLNNTENHSVFFKWNLVCMLLRSYSECDFTSRELSVAYSRWCHIDPTAIWRHTIRKWKSVVICQVSCTVYTWCFDIILFNRWYSSTGSNLWSDGHQPHMTLLALTCKHRGCCRSVFTIGTHTLCLLPVVDMSEKCVLQRFTFLHAFSVPL